MARIAVAIGKDKPEQMAPAMDRPFAACRQALIDALKRSAPTVVVDGKGYVGDASDNLVPGVPLDAFEVDLRQGDGNELEGKFRAAHSSSALVANTFAPFKGDPAALRLPSGREFTEVGFERKCHHGIKGRRSPNLDLVAEGPDGVVAIESKCLEFLSRHTAKFSHAYESGIQGDVRESAWFREMRRLRNAPHTYRWLDAAQLVKHAFGLAHTFPDRAVTLLYLYWEPANPQAYPIFAEHRAEVKMFAASIADSRPGFTAMSYPELWSLWKQPTRPGWLREHIARLKARYGVAVA